MISTTHRRWLLAAAVVALFAVLTLFIQLSASTRRTNGLVEQLYQSKNELLNDEPRSIDLKILVVGLISSPSEMNDRVTTSLIHLCTVFTEVDIHIVYDGHLESSSSFPWWDNTSCRRTNVVPQADLLQTAALAAAADDHGSTVTDFDKMNRFQKLALLRSLQRQSILQQQVKEHSSSNYVDVVINLDLDVTAFPPYDSLVQAVRRSFHDKVIVCANGYETWHLPWGNTKLYYDTLAAVEMDGTWWYRSYAANLWQIVTLGQARLFQTLLLPQSRSDAARTKMQSCFGGLAVYDYNTWATESCDYTTTSEQANEWKLPVEYTLPSGDACEHLVFQQCLRHSLPSLQAAIQPNLVIGRDAALFSTREAKMGLFKAVLLLALLSYGCRKTLRHYSIRRSKKKTLQK